MKRIYSLILLAAMLCLPSYSRTPKEYFEAENNVYAIYDDIETLDNIDRDLYWHLVDSCKQQVCRYVYDKLLPGMDPTSIEYADVLLRLCPFIYSDNLRSVAQQIQGIVAPKEGKSKRFLDAKYYETLSWGIDAESGYWIHTFGQDTIDRVIQLHKEMIDLSHSVCRPTDQRYIQLIKNLTNLELYRYEQPEYEDYNRDYLIPYSCHLAAVLWDDLVRWDSISEEEYDLIEFGEKVVIFDLPDLYEDWGEHWDFVRAMTYYGGRCPEDQIRFFCSNEQLVRRIAGTQSKWYCNAADSYVEVLKTHSTRQVLTGVQDTLHLMERAEAVCQNVLRNARLSKDSIAYYEWKLKDFQCRMSLGETSKKMQKELDKLSKSVRQFNDTLLMNDYLLVQSEHALLAGNEKYAVQVLTDYLKTLPLLPDKEDDAYYKIAYKLYDPVFQALARIHMIIGNYDLSRQYLSLDNDIVYNGYYTNPDKSEVGMLLHQGNAYYWECGYPYRVTFKQPFYQHLLELCDFQPEEY
jgi:hypothetical protein